MFCALEPWEEQLFADVQDKCDFLIPVSDEVAYIHYPQYNWVYNKIRICETQGIEAFPHGVRPRRYPIFSKPITNLYGMSEEAEVKRHWDQDRDYKPGHFWMPVLEGEQLSTDLAVKKGMVVWSYSMKATLKKNGTFDRWDTCETPEELLHFLTRWARKYLPGYCGILNFETIGSKIIECHLRMAEQWVDLYGPGWLESVIKLHRSGRWTFVGGKERGISKPLWIKKDGHPYVMDPGRLEELRQHVTSIQLTWRKGHLLSHETHDVNGYRVAVINGFDVQAVEKVSEELKEIIGVSNEVGCDLLEWY